MQVMFSIVENKSRHQPEVLETLSGVSEEISEVLDEDEVKARVQRWLREIAGVRGLTESRASMFRRIAAVVRLPSSRVENMFYGESRRIDAFEYLRIERAAGSSIPLWKHYKVPFPKR